MAWTVTLPVSVTWSNAAAAAAAWTSTPVLVIWAGLDDFVLDVDLLG